MAKRKDDKTKPAAARPAQETAAPAPARWWPEEFLAPGPTAIIVVAGLLTSAFLGFLVMENGLIGFKQFLAYLIGLRNPLDVGVPAVSRDAGAVLIGFIWTLIGAAIHPAIGIGVLALFRPWLDGYTFPTDNMYFVWGTMLCFAVWGVRTVMSGEPVRAWRPTLFFAAFPLVAWLLSSWSINYNDTYRGLVLWPTYVILFFLIANMGSKPRIFRVLIGVITLSIAMEAVFAVMQYRYILPYLRALIQQDPNILKSVFGVDNPSVELARRFQINRAFGTVLFPNALAAFLITWIPLFAVSAWNSLKTWQALSNSEPESRKLSQKERYNAVALGAISWFIGLIAIYVIFQFPVTYKTTMELPWYLGTYAAIGVSAGIALLPAAGILLLGLSRGAGYALVVVRAALYTLALLVCCYALFITFSRGGMLGLGAGCAVAVALLLLSRPGKIPSFLARFAVQGAAATLVLVCLVAQAPAPAANTAPATPQLSQKNLEPTSQITTSGQNVALEDLASGASFRARFTYWRVALSMFLDNAVTGVGLKCFGWAYPKYQYIGAFDVREAHNGFLQAYCETGLLGGTVLLLFWGYIVVTAALRTLQELDPQKKLVFAGITAGLVAFLFHTLMDINFSHPTLMFFVCVLSGMLFALSPAPQPSRIAHLSVLPALLIAALCAGAGLRIYTQDLGMGRVSLIGVSDEKELDMRLSVGRYFLRTVIDNAAQKQKPPAIYFASANAFIADVDACSKLGVIFAKGPDGHAKILQPGEVIPDDAMMVVNKPWLMRKVALEAAKKVVAEAEAIDARFPHNPKIASYIAEWYQLMLYCENTTPTREHVAEYQTAALRWTETAQKRNRWHAGLMNNLADVYFQLGQTTQDKDNTKYFEQAWDCMSEAAALAPATPQFWAGLRYAAEVLGNSYEKAKQPEKAAEYRALEQKYEKYTGEVITRRVQLGIDAPGGPPPANAPEEKKP